MAEQPSQRDLEERLARLEHEMAETRAMLARLEPLLPETGQAHAAAPKAAEPPPRETPPAPEPVWTFDPVQEPAPPVPPAPVVPPMARPPVVPPVMPPARPAPRRRPSPQRRPAGRSWEEVVGRQWALWAGTALVFATVALLLAMNWRDMGAMGQLAIGALVGVAFLAGGEWSRGKVDRTFSAGLAGGGLAVLYLDAWAAMARYHVLGFNQTLPLMVGVAMLGVFLALRYDAISLSVLAAVGGFLTPALLGGGTGAGGVAPFLAYVAVLNAGILAVSLFKAWRPLTWLAFVSTVLLVTGWAMDADLVAGRWTVFAYFSLYLALFVGAASFRGLARREVAEPGDLALIITAAAAYFTAGHFLISPVLGGFPAAFPLGLAVAFGLFALFSWVTAAGRTLLPQTGLALAVVFTTLAIPIQLQQGWVAVGWSMEAAALLTLASLYGGVVLRRGGQTVWLLSLLGVLSAALAPRPAAGALFLNGTALPLLVSALSTFWVLTFLRRRGDAQNDELSAFYAIVAVLGGALLIGREITYGFAGGRIPWPNAEPYAVSILLSLYGVAAFAAGLYLRDIVVRSCALGVAALAAVMPMWMSATTATTAWTPFWNPRWLSAVVSAGVAGLLGWLASRENDALAEGEAEVAGRLPVVMHLLVLWGLTVEVIRSIALYPPGIEAVTPVAVGTLWTVYGALLLVSGLGRRDASLRVLAGLAGGGGAILLFAFGTATAWTFVPFGNPRFSMFLLAAGAAAMTARVTRLQTERGDQVDPWDLSVGAATLSAALLLWGASVDTYVAASQGVANAPYALPVGAAAVAMVWAMACVTLVALGRAWRRAELGQLGYGAGLIGGLLLLAPSLQFAAAATPVLNIRFAAFALSVVTLPGAARINRLDPHADKSPARWAEAGAAVVAVWGICVEVGQFYAHAAVGDGVDTGSAASLAISVVCALSAVALSALGWRARRPEFRAIGGAALAVGGALLMSQAIGTLGTPMRPLLNLRAAAFVATIAAMTTMAGMIGRSGGETEAVETGLRDLLLPAALILGFWAVTQETHGAFLYFRQALGTGWERWAQSGISLAWTVFATGLLVGGALRHNRHIRWVALGLFGVTIIKVMVFDLGSLDVRSRILSTAVLGLALIGISWLYSRYGVGREEGEAAGGAS